MPRLPLAVSRLILPTIVMAAAAAVATEPTGAELGATINRVAAWASPPRDNIRPMHGNRYRRMERAWEESFRKAVREYESSPDFVGPPSPASA
jgi:hypothetical protein